MYKKVKRPFLINGCQKFNRSVTTLAFSTEYQAVFFDNGQVFFGKLENAGSSYPILRNVFYLQSQVNKDTKEVKSALVKMGKEWHEPDLMYINSQHILIIEPVSSASRVAQLIKEANEPKNESAVNTHGLTPVALKIKRQLQLPFIYLFLKLNVSFYDFFVYANG